MRGDGRAGERFPPAVLWSEYFAPPVPIGRVARRHGARRPGCCERPRERSPTVPRYRHPPSMIAGFVLLFVPCSAMPTISRANRCIARWEAFKPVGALIVALVAQVMRSSPEPAWVFHCELDEGCSVAFDDGAAVTTGWKNHVLMTNGLEAPSNAPARARFGRPQASVNADLFPEAMN